MIEVSAVYRTPIEIWTMILYRALATPALPFIDGPYGYLGTDILKNIRLFPSKCALYKEFIMMKSTAETFRLVCRTWATILANIRYRCIFANYDGTSHPMTTNIDQCVYRVQISNDNDPDDENYECFLCACLFSDGGGPCFFLDRPHSKLEQQKNWIQVIDDTILTKAFQQVRILDLDNRKLDTKKLISFMPNLRALSLGFPGIRNNSAQSLAFLPRNSHLTHLKLTTLTWTSFCREFGGISSYLCSLQYLELFLFIGRDGKTDKIAPRVNWSLSTLRNLCIRGILECEVKEEFDTFVSHCGNTVTELIKTCSFEDLPDSLSSDSLSFLGEFPHLSLYGTSVDSIMALLISNSQFKAKPSYQPSTCRTLLLEGIIYSLSLEPERLIRGLVSLNTSWGFKYIILDDTWDSLQRSDIHQRWFKKFIDGALNTDLKFSDSNGIEIRDPKCTELWVSKGWMFKRHVYI
jgi:hypothetical protein